VRNAGYKLAPIDTDLFPGSFNNLSPEVLPLAVQAAMAAIEKICPEAKNLLLIPESHDSKTFDPANMRCLMQVLTQAGLNVRVGSLDKDIKSPTKLGLADGSELTLEPLLRTRGRLGLKDFDPCTILLNNDLAGGVPDMLKGLHEQYLLPPLHAGWTVRTKLSHFQAYEEVAKKFSKLLGMDPWLITPMFATTPAVKFATGAGLDALQSNADALLAKIKRKHKDYGIQEKPFVVIKSDLGTCGMGLMTVRDAKELAQLKPRMLEMAGPDVNEREPVRLILQEGVPTFERVNNAVAEPVVYMVDRYVVGGFYRVHAERGSDERLDIPGASFVPLAFAQSSHLPRRGEVPGASAPNRFYMYGVIARLAMLAASYELEATDPDRETYE
jgi:glutamate--cysteine ligase